MPVAMSQAWQSFVRAHEEPGVRQTPAWSATRVALLLVAVIGFACGAVGLATDAMGLVVAVATLGSVLVDLGWALATSRDTSESLLQRTRMAIGFFAAASLLSLFALLVARQAEAGVLRTATVVCAVAALVLIHLPSLLRLLLKVNR